MGFFPSRNSSPEYIPKSCKNFVRMTKQRGSGVFSKGGGGNFVSLPSTRITISMTSHGHDFLKGINPKPLAVQATPLYVLCSAVCEARRSRRKLYTWVFIQPWFDQDYLKHNELHLLLPRGSRGLGSSYFQDVKAATGKEIFKQEYPLKSRKCIIQANEQRHPLSTLWTSIG